MSYTFELNNARQDSMNIKDMKKVQRIAEINMAMLTGQDVGKYGKEKDEVVKFMSTLGEKASAGDTRAMAELNTIVKIGIAPLLEKQMEIYNFLGNYKKIGMNETPVVHTYTYEGLGADIQAKGSDVTYADRKEVEYSIPTQTISAGMRYNYRHFANGNFSGSNAEEIEQIQTTMHNKGVAFVMDVLTKALKNNTTGVKFYAEYDNEVTQTAIDSMVSKIRPMGKVSILSDITNAMAISDFNGWKSVGESVLPFYTPSQVEEIANQGYNGSYKGADNIVLPNAYNFSKPLADKTAFEKYYNSDNIFFVAQGVESPLNIIRRGGLTSMTGTDVDTGSILQRFDMELGADVVKGREFQIGLLTKKTS